MNWIRRLLALIRAIVARLFGQEAQTATMSAGLVFEIPTEGESEMENIQKTITVTQGFILTPKFLKADGSAATIDGVPVWDHNIPAGSPLTLGVAADGLSAQVQSSDRETVGDVDFTVNVTADADLDAGEERLLTASAFVSVHIIPAEAVEGVIEAGEVVEIPNVDTVAAEG